MAEAVHRFNIRLESPIIFSMIAHANVLPNLQQTPGVRSLINISIYCPQARTCNMKACIHASLDKFDAFLWSPARDAGVSRRLLTRCVASAPHAGSRENWLAELLSGH